MGNWYRVTKRINGRLYLYWQKTYRVGSSVKTLNKYIGPGANPPRARSLRAQMQNLPDAHKALRKELDRGKISKAEYLETILTISPSLHAPQPVPPPATTTQYEQTVAEHRAHIIRGALHAAISNATAPPEKKPEREPKENRDEYDEETWREMMRERREERKRYREGMQRQEAAVRKAKRQTRGIKKLNPFIALALLNTKKNP